MVKQNDSKGERGTDWEKSPWCDLNQVTKLVGFPCAVAEMPNTVIKSKCKFTGTYNGNMLIDMYAHWRGKGDMNYDIWPPFSKLLNTQIQCNFAHKRMPNQHAYGWSGAKVLFEATVGGVTWKVGHKLEKLGGNLFDFLSWCAWDGEKYVEATDIDCGAIWAWTLENWESVIEPAAKKAGVKFQPRLTIENLKASYCDGIHMGSEVLGECDGEVVWDNLEMFVGDVPERPAANDPVAKKPVKEDKEKPNKGAKKKSTAKVSDKAGQLVVTAGEEKRFVNSWGYDGHSDVKPMGIASVTGIWHKFVKITGAKPGDCVITFKKKGKEIKVPVKVI